MTQQLARSTGVCCLYHIAPTGLSTSIILCLSLWLVLLLLKLAVIYIYYCSNNAAIIILYNRSILRSSTTTAS